MKKIYKAAEILITVLCVVLNSTSCLDDEEKDLTLSGNISRYIPAYSVEANYYAFTEDESYFVVMQTENKADFEIWGLRVKSVEYLLGVRSIGIATEAPFTVGVRLTDTDITDMKVRARVTVGGDKANDYTFTVDASKTYKMPEECIELFPELAVKGLACATVARKDEKAYIYAIPELHQEYIDAGCKICRIDYFWEGEKIGTVDSSPFILNTELSAMANGEYNVSAHFVVSNSDGREVEKDISETVYVLNHTKPNIDIFWDYNYVSSGDVFSITPIILEEFSKEKAKIIDARCRVNDGEAETFTESPYTFNYAVVEPDGSEFKITYQLTFENETKAKFIYTFGGNISVGYKYGVYGAGLQCSTPFFKNGQEIPLFVRFVQGTESENKIRKVSLYIDESLVATTSVSPYYCKYKLSGFTKGVHILKKIVEYDNYSTTMYDYFVVED